MRTLTIDRCHLSALAIDRNNLFDTVFSIGDALLSGELPSSLRPWLNSRKHSGIHGKPWEVVSDVCVYRTSLLSHAFDRRHLWI